MSIKSLLTVRPSLTFAFRFRPDLETISEARNFELADGEKVNLTDPWSNSSKTVKGLFLTKQNGTLRFNRINRLLSESSLVKNPITVLSAGYAHDSKDMGKILESFGQEISEAIANIIGDPEMPVAEVLHGVTVTLTDEDGNLVSEASAMDADSAQTLRLKDFVSVELNTVFPSSLKFPVVSDFKSTESNEPTPVYLDFKINTPMSANFLARKSGDSSLFSKVREVIASKKAEGISVHYQFDFDMNAPEAIDDQTQAAIRELAALGGNFRLDGHTLLITI